MERSLQAPRITSIDILRGLVMIIMALDHTRDFFHETAMTADPLDPATTTPALYFTRWITHFCAPVFVFLSGLSAWLSAQKKPRKEASLFLVKRGLWLVLIEITVVSFGITFNPHFNFFILQVIWVIGWSMVLLGILHYFSSRLVLALGILLFLGHNLLDLVDLPQTGLAAGALRLFFRSGGFIPIDDSHQFMVLYAILPWAAAMFVGYGIGPWFSRDFPAAKRRQYLYLTGFSMIALFIILRSTNAYGNPLPWNRGDGFLFNLFAFLNTSKYPPSLQYLCMTLGPACLLLAGMENIRSGWSRVVTVFGQVPFFYYVLHFYLLHILLVIVFFATGHNSAEIAGTDMLFPIWFRPLQFGFDLWVVYLIWAFVVFLLYFPCRWYNAYKKENRHQWWLSYV